MAQLDDDVGLVMAKLKALGVDDNTIVVFTTDNGTEVFTWPDGGQTPFAQSKGTVMEGGFRVPAIIKWPGKVPAGKVENGLMSGLDWFPTLVAAAGNPNIAGGPEAGQEDRRHDVTRCTSTATTRRRCSPARVRRTGTRSSTSARARSARCASTTTSTVSSTSRNGWLGAKNTVDVPYLTNLRLDPFERTGWPNDGAKEGSQQYFDWFKFEFWRFVFVQQQVAKLAQTAIEFPPMQRGASFNLEAVKAQIEAARAAMAK